jgi:type I restriction enzyme, S subunit
MNNWNEMELGKAIQFNPTERIKKGKIAKKIPMDRLTAYEKKIKGFENAAYSAGPKFKNGDTLVAKITPCLENGKTAQVDILDEDEVAFGSSEFIVLRQNEFTINDFIFYLAKSPAFRKRAIGCMEGTSGRKRVNEGALKLQVLPIPDKITQQKIASVLSALDSKIELNNRINAELEAMAKTLYDYWFVQFDFPDKKGKPYKTSGGKMVWNEELKREIPEGWEVQKIASLTDLISRGISPNYIENGGVCVLNQKCIRENTVLFEFSRRHNQQSKSATSRKVNLYDVLVNSTGVGTLGRVAIVKRLPENFIIVDSHVTIIRPDIKKINPLYFGFSLIQKQKEIEGFSVGSTGQVELSKSQLQDIQLITPQTKIQDLFDKTYVNSLERTSICERENQKLTELRDWLLPMLMNGQVKVN